MFDENNNGMEEEYVKPKLSRKKVQQYFVIALGVGLLLVYLLLYFMGNPFSVDDSGSKIVNGNSLFYVLGLITLWFINSELFFLSSKWYLDKATWKIKQWLSLGISIIFIAVLYLVNLLMGLYIFGIAGVVLILYGFSLFNGEVIKAVINNTEDDLPKEKNDNGYNVEYPIKKKSRSKGDLND